MSPGRPRSMREHMKARMEADGHVPLARPSLDQPAQQINLAELREQNPDLDAAIKAYRTDVPPPAPRSSARPLPSEQVTQVAPRPAFDPETRDKSQDVRQINLADLHAEYPELVDAMNRSVEANSDQRDYLSPSPADLKPTEVMEAVRYGSGHHGGQGPEMG